MAKKRSTWRLDPSSLEAFVTNVWTQIAGIVIAAGFGATGLWFLLYERAREDLDLKAKIAEYQRGHPEIVRTTEMIAAFDRFETSFQPKMALAADAVQELGKAKESGQLEPSYVDKTSRSLQEMISELEDERGTVSGFSVSGDHKDLQRVLIADLELQEQLCRELITALNHWTSATVDERNSHFDTLINLAQRSEGAMAELKTRDSKPEPKKRHLANTWSVNPAVSV